MLPFATVSRSDSMLAVKAVSKMAGQPINALFTSADLPEYRTYSPENCSMCRNRQKIDAICNGFGYSTVN